MTKFKCSLCPQFFDDGDSLFSNRKLRHEDHHDPTKPKGSMNQTFGKVEWTKIPDEK